MFPPSTNPTRALLALDGWLAALEDGLHVTRRPIFFGWDDVNSLAGALQGIVADLLVHADDGDGRARAPRGRTNASGIAIYSDAADVALRFRGFWRRNG